MTVTRGSLSNLIAPGYRKIIFGSYKEKPAEADKWVNKQTEDSRMYVEDFPIAGFPTLSEKVEGGPVAYADPVQGTVKRYTFTRYGLGFRVTEEMYEDDLYGVTKPGGKMAKALGRSARHNYEVVAHSILNNGFSTSFVGFTAGESLFSTSHALLRGGTYANRPATDVDFGLLAFQAAIENFNGLVTEEGFPMQLKPKWLLHGYSDQWIVNQVLKSQFLPGTQQNDINVANGMATPIMSSYLTDTDSWYLLAEDHDLNYISRTPIKLSNTDDFDTGDAKFKLTRRHGAGFGDWRGAYASSGA